MTVINWNLNYLKLKLTFTVRQPTLFTRFPGSTIRDLFRTSLREVCCPRRRCLPAQCDAVSTCGFAALCHPAPQVGTAMAKPYVFALPPWPQRPFQPGESFPFYLTLFGRAVKHTREVFLSLEHLENLDIERFQYLVELAEIRKLGPPDTWPAACRPRGKIKITGIEPVAQGELNGNSPSTNRDRPGPDSAGKLQLLSPCRIIQTVTPVAGRRRRQPLTAGQVTLEHILGAIVNRLSLLAAGSVKSPLISMDETTADQAALKPVKPIKDVKIRRYSAKKRRSHQIDGIIGTWSWQEMPSLYRDILKIGEKIHLGSGATMGFGQIKVHDRNPAQSSKKQLLTRTKKTA